MSRGRKPLGRLIVFEGPDGVGRSTLSARTAEALNAVSLPCELLTFPEPGTLGKVVYDIHHRPEAFGISGLTASSRQALHLAAHIDAIERRIKPLIQSRRHVILDRFWWSIWVDGLVSGTDRRTLKRLVALERQFWGTLKPAIAFVIKRSRPMNRDDHTEAWPKLLHEYELLASHERKRHRVCIVQNEGSLDESVAEILRLLGSNGIIIPAKSAVAATPATRTESRDSSNLFSEKNGAGSLILKHLLPAKPTVVFDTYWRFAAERQRIFYERLKGSPYPWTDDPILATYKFTNAYRASDRVSQYLIRHVIYRKDLPSSPTEVFFRIILFKIFNKIETWQHLEHQFGPIMAKTFSFEKYDRAFSAAMAEGTRIYSAAYIMPTGGRGSTETRKHRLHLRLIESMLKDELPKKLSDAKTMHHAFDLLRSYPTIGDFLAYQYVTDVNYSEITSFSEMSFVVPGPGAIDGMRKCFVDRGGLTDPEIIRLMADIQESEFDRLGLDFQSLWGRPLQLIDCQNLFCEVDKYSRVKHPDIVGVTGRTRIKQKFEADATTIQFWYPPKWNINHLIPASAGRNESINLFNAAK